MDITFTALLHRVCRDISLDPQAEAYIYRRVMREGYCILSELLPACEKYVLRCLELGRLMTKSETKSFDPELFRRTHFTRRSPRFLHGLLSKIFDLKTGEIWANPCPDALSALRQLCSYFYKLDLSFDDRNQVGFGSYNAKCTQAIENFHIIERELNQLTLDNEAMNELRVLAENLFAPIRHKTVEDVLSSNKPRYGPGAFSLKHRSDATTYDRRLLRQIKAAIKGRDHARLYHRAKHVNPGVYGITYKSQKGLQGYFDPSLDRERVMRKSVRKAYKLSRSIPTMGDILIENPLNGGAMAFKHNAYMESIEDSVAYQKYVNSSNVSNRSFVRGDAQDYLSKLSLVPKDSRGPRIISAEPLWTLQAQMSFFGFFSKSLERITRNRINFVDQSINGNIALESSKTREYATLDLKDASDRVSLRLVRNVFRNFPFIRYFLNNFRTTHIYAPYITEDTDYTAGIHSLPKGEFKLRKVAGMGSGLTFTIMSAITYLIAVRAICKHTGLKPKNVCKDVYIYGDDLIVKTEYFDVVSESIQTFGLKVSSAKCFANGNFRESCGIDAFWGFNVTPVRAKFRSVFRAPYRGAHNRLKFLSSNVKFRSLYTLCEHVSELTKRGFYKLADYWCQVITGIIDQYNLCKGKSVSFVLTSDVGQYVGLNADILMSAIDRDDRFLSLLDHIDNDDYSSNGEVEVLKVVPCQDRRYSSSLDTLDICLKEKETRTKNTWFERIGLTEYHSGISIDGLGQHATPIRYQMEAKTEKTRVRNLYN
jgi:hypothetical protein